MLTNKLHGYGTLSILAVALIFGCSQQAPLPSKLSPKVTPDISVIVAPPKSTSTPISNAPRQLTVFLPGPDGKLHETKLNEPGDLAKKQLWEPESALTLLFRKAPQFIPANTRLTDSIRKNNNYPDPNVGTVFEVRLNKEFLNSQLWRDKRKAGLAFDAIVKTAASGISETIKPTYPVNIHVLVNERPVTKLGEIKIKNPS